MSSILFPIPSLILFAVLTTAKHGTDTKNKKPKEAPIQDTIPQQKHRVCHCIYTTRTIFSLIF